MNFTEEMSNSNIIMYIDIENNVKKKVIYTLKKI